MYSYTISKEVKEEKFFETCEIIEKSIKDYKKSDLLMDVDGSLIQKYSTPKGLIKVFNDYDIYAVYVDSEIEIPALNKYIILIK